MRTVNYLAMAILVASAASMTVACSDDETNNTTTTSSTGSSGGGMGTGGMGTGGMGTGGMGTGGNTSSPDCNTYCDTIDKNCTGANQQYTNKTVCMDVCNNIPAGDASDMMGNTVGCRTYHAGAPAAADPALHCHHAGPAGDGQCGGDCESFCALNEAICGYGASGTAQFADQAACMTACGKMDMTTKYDASATSATDNSFACHMYHLTAAAGDANTHCPHTNPATDGPCGPTL